MLRLCDLAPTSPVGRSWSTRKASQTAKPGSNEASKRQASGETSDQAKIDDRAVSIDTATATVTITRRDRGKLIWTEGPAYKLELPAHRKWELNFGLYIRIMDLPRELRDLIWLAKLRSLDLPRRLILREANFYHDDSRKANDLRFPPVIPAFCYINRQIFGETLPLFLSERELVFGSSRDISRLGCLLERIPDGEGYRSIRSIVLEDRVRWSGQVQAGVGPSCRTTLTRYGEDLLQRCTGLHHIAIERCAFRCSRLCCNKRRGESLGDASRSIMKYPKDRLVREMDLSCLLVCSNLRTVTLRCIRGDCFARKGGCTTQEDFADWVDCVREIIGNKPRVRLEVEYVTLKLWRGLETYMGWAKDTETKP